MKTIVKIAGVAVPLVIGAVNSEAVTFAPSTAPQTQTGSTAGNYIQQVFTFGLSANVGLAYTESATNIAVNSGNTKGKFSFGGNSTGGSIAACTTSVSTANGYSVAAPGTAANGCS